jgi:1-phosphatidylinositol-4-phosphate 5-kinase
MREEENMEDEEIGFINSRNMKGGSVNINFNEDTSSSFTTDANMADIAATTVAAINTNSTINENNAFVEQSIKEEKKSSIISTPFEQLLSQDHGAIDARSPFGMALEAQARLPKVDQSGVGVQMEKAGGRRYISRSKPGEITREHEQFNLTYAVMIGIRHVVGSMVSRDKQQGHRVLEDVSIQDMKRGLISDHFIQTSKLVFPPEGGKSQIEFYRTPPHMLKGPFKFKDYAPEVFFRLRKRFQINTEDYMNSLCGSFNFVEFITNSKSGQFFFYSYDGLYLIKTMAQREARALLKMLPDYYSFVAENLNTMLVRFCGMHRVKIPHMRRRMHLIIMRSVFQDDSPERPIFRVYDLKGSTKGRRSKEGETVRKDLDIIDDKQMFKLGPNKERFLSQLKRDVQFLQKLNVMDYSLLVGISSKKKAAELVMAASNSVSTPDMRPALLKFRSARPSIMEPLNFAEVLKANGIGGPAYELGRPGSASSIHPSRSNLGSKPRSSTLNIDSFSCIDSRTSDGAEDDEVYLVGIIDIIQTYSVTKHLESIMKGLGGGRDQISAVDPKTYANRLVDFVEKHIV